MKTIKFTIAVVLFFITAGITAQAKININLGTPPVWAPTAPVKVQYYYLPDIETYYDVPSKQYIYSNNGVWTRTASLPNRYRTYDLYKGRTVYLNDYRGNTPYLLYKEHRVKYAGNRNWKPNGHDNGNHYGNYKRNHKNFDNENHEDHDSENHQGHDNENHGNGNHGNGHGKK